MLSTELGGYFKNISRAFRLRLGFSSCMFPVSYFIQSVLNLRDDPSSCNYSSMRTSVLCLCLNQPAQWGAPQQALRKEEVLSRGKLRGGESTSIMVRSLILWRKTETFSMYVSIDLVRNFANKKLQNSHMLISGCCVLCILNALCEISRLLVFLILLSVPLKFLFLLLQSLINYFECDITFYQVNITGIRVCQFLMW